MLESVSAAAFSPDEPGPWRTRLGQVAKQFPEFLTPAPLIGSEFVPRHGVGRLIHGEHRAGCQATDTLVEKCTAIHGVRLRVRCLEADSAGAIRGPWRRGGGFRARVFGS